MQVQPSLRMLSVGDSPVASLAGWTVQPVLRELYFRGHSITQVSPLAGQVSLRKLLFWSADGITDAHTLQPLVDAGCSVDILPR